MADNYDAILDHEEKFAKNLAFQLRAGRPQPAWHFFVPFKFLLRPNGKWINSPGNSFS